MLQSVCDHSKQVSLNSESCFETGGHPNQIENNYSVYRKVVSRKSPCRTGGRPNRVPVEAGFEYCVKFKDDDLRTIDIHILHCRAELIGRHARVGTEVISVQLLDVQAESFTVLSYIPLIDLVFI